MNYKYPRSRMMQRTAVAMVAAIMLMGFGAWYFLGPTSSHPVKDESIIFGNVPTESSALIYIAQEQNFFSENGLNVTIRDYDSGIAAITGMLNGEVDMAAATEYPVVGKAFEKSKIQTIANIDKNAFMHSIIGRKDRGIRNISDLKGKKIGITRGTITEFYLGRFFDLHGMSIQQVSLVNITGDSLDDAIINGSIDAAITRRPYVNIVENRLGDNAVIWPVQSSQAMYEVIVGQDDWIAGHPETVNRFLESLARAEEYAVQHPTEAKAIVQRQLNLSDTYIAAIWPENRFSLSLDQSLITAMEDEARWMISNNLTTERTVPDFTDYINTKGLEEVKPDAVNIW